MTAHPPDAVLVEEPLRPDVQRHLTACPKCRITRRILAETAPSSPGEADPERWTDEGRLPPDGTGERWEVWDRDLGRRVVRVQPPAGARPEHLRAVAAVLGRLRHPHLCQVHQVSDGPPVVYLRDLVDGGHLDDHDVAEDPRAVAWLAQCASALAVLHEAGLAHGGLVATAVRITSDGRVVVVGAGANPDATPDDDWRAVSELFAGMRGPVAEVVARLGAEDPERRITGTELLGWLLALRDPGAGGGGRYEPRGLLGIGGMGEVRRVYDPLLERIVAQKVLAASLLEKREHVAGFLAEAKITAQLQHPGIVPVHDMESLPNGAVAFTMKQIEGRTLAEVIKEVHVAGPDRWETSTSGWHLRRLVSALRGVCDAIAYAHDQGVVHLDLKPHNVMVGDYGEVLVVDWGLARRLGGPPDASRSAGTPGFMAPEQGNGGTAELGPAADIYALGACLREILDGEPPEADGTETKERPGAARGRWSPLHPRAPRELASVVRRAMQPEAADRYDSAKALAADLQAWLDERWVSAHDYRWTEVLRRRLRPHQAPIIVVALAAVVLIAAGAVALVRLSAAGEATRNMTAQSLVDRANLAFDANDRVRAEAFAAFAVGLHDRPDARGLLARLARGWRPELLGSRDHICAEVVVVGDPQMVVCATDTAVHGWSLDGSITWPYGGTYRGLGPTSSGGWMAFNASTVLEADASTGAQVNQIYADGEIIDAVSLRAGAVAVAVEREIRVIGRGGRPGAVVELESDIVELAPCGRDRVAVLTTGTQSQYGNGLYIVDLNGDGAATPLLADLAGPPLACSANGRYLAVASDRSVQLWNVDGGRQRHILAGHLGEIRALTWASDGRTLATASEDGTVRVWDARAGAEIGRLAGDDEVYALAFAELSGGREALVTATAGGVRHWGLPPAGAVGEFDAVVQVVALHWSLAEDHTLFTVDRLGRPHAFDPTTGLQKMPIFLEDETGSSLQVGAIDPHRDGERLAVVTRSGAVGVVDLDEALFTWDQTRAHAGGGTAVAWRPHADLVVSGGAAGDVRAWMPPTDGGTEPTLAWQLGVGGAVAALRWSADGRVLVARTRRDGGNVVIIGPDGAPRFRVPGPIVAHAVGPEGKQVALAWGTGKLGVMSLPPQVGSPHEPAVLNPTANEYRSLLVDGPVEGVAFSPTDPQLLATVSREGLVQVFHTADGSELARLFALPGGATDLAFSLDGSVLAIAGAQGEIVLMDTGVIQTPPGDLEASARARYGVDRTGTDLEFR